MKILITSASLVLICTSTVLDGRFEPAPQDPPQRQQTTSKIKSGDAAVRVAGPTLDSEQNAFPPTISDVTWHRDAWERNDCLRCHETGVGKAPELRHDGMPERLLTAKCRTCHVFVPGSHAKPERRYSGPFESWAFPPMIPASGSHPATWERNDCLLCHDSGVRGAPIIEHANLPRILLRAKCRTCHVQVRAVEASERGRR